MIELKQHKIPDGSKDKLPIFYNFLLYNELEESGESAWKHDSRHQTDYQPEPSTKIISKIISF